MGKVYAILGVLVAGCMASDREVLVDDSSISIPAVYTRYLKFPVPSYNIEAEFNPPVLRWPVENGRSHTYDVRLSMDSLFGEDGVVSVSRLPWAMFNPHTKLAHGQWYWQCRISGREWSEVNRFVVDDKSVELVSPRAEIFLQNVPEDHPRILAGGSDIKMLRMLPEDVDRNAIMRDADAVLRKRIPKEKDGLPRRSDGDKERDKKLKQDASNSLGKGVYTTVSTLSQAWLLSGETAYLHRAKALALEVASWDPQGVTGSKVNDFSDARCMLAMALVFDTFHDELSLSERSVLSKAISARADGFYRSWINNQEVRLLSGHVWQHILHYFFQTSLAMYGHEPAAADWLAYAYELFLARTPILGGNDGGWTEGASYFRMNMETVIDVPLFIKKYTGFDFIKAHPWYINNIEWLIYHVPPGSSADGFGDNAEEVFSPGLEYSAFAKEISKLTGNRLAAWYAHKCAQYEQPDLSSKDILRWVRLTKTRDLAMPDPLEDPILPTGRLFSAIGLASMHSKPLDPGGDLTIAIRSSPFGCYGHFLSDQNAFNILYGGKRTFFRTGYKVTMNDPHRTGWYQHTKSNNSILINGEGQPYSTEAFGLIRKFIAGNEIAYTLADASNAYSSVETKENHGVKKFYRHLLLLKPDIIVIYDELEAEEDSEWSWLIHSMSQIRVDTFANTFESSFGHATGIGRLWSSDPVKFFLADTFEIPAMNWRGSRDASGKLRNYEQDQWHLKAVTLRNVSTARFLAVLQVSPSADQSTITTSREGGKPEIVAGEWMVSASLDAGLSPELIVKNGSGDVAFKYEEGRDPVLTESVDGKQTRTNGHDILPIDVKQSLLYYSNHEQEIDLP